MFDSIDRKKNFNSGGFSITIKIKKGIKNQNSNNQEKNSKNCSEIELFLFNDCVLPLTDLTLKNLADIFSVNKDTDSLIDGHVSLFVRTILGY